MISGWVGKDPKFYKSPKDDNGKETQIACHFDVCLDQFPFAKPQRQEVWLTLRFYGARAEAVERQRITQGDFISADGMIRCNTRNGDRRYFLRVNNWQHLPHTKKSKRKGSSMSDETEPRYSAEAESPI